MQILTKRQLRAVLEAQTDTALASFFGISPSAVSQWSEEEPIPERRMLQLAVRRPELLAKIAAAADASPTGERAA